MIRPLHWTNRQRSSNSARSYATDADFQQLFTTEMADFFRLSLQLTADFNKAERCFTLAMKDCFDSNSVIKGFARTWARRMVIRNAIHVVLGVNDEFVREEESVFHLQPRRDLVNELRESLPIMELSEFDRLVFVTCVLEHLSILDCALLLRKSPKDVNDAIARATNQIASRPDHNDTELSTASRTISCKPRACSMKRAS
jgi:DNA-directed RNA polymerase specialized sigma24 family protein